jgi:sulfoxide reductase heme-binding subunit YedZ
VSTQILWFATRGAGIVSMLLFTAVVVLGVVTTMRWQSDRWPRFLIVEVHRTISLLSVVFLAVHILTAILDPFTNLGLAAALVPFASSYRPLWVGLGVLSLYIGVAVLATSLLRDRVGLRLWRAVHWLAYASWPLALVHSIFSGSDSTAPWMLAVYVLCIVPVAVAVAWRILAARGSNRSVLASVAEPRRGA